MDRISITSGAKKIEVNDEGEYIILPVGDDSFIKRFYEIMDELQAKAAGIEMNDEDILGSINAVVDIDEKLRIKVDELIGEGTCRKVFGDMLPGLDMFIEFFAAILPFLEEHQKARIEKMNKYSAGRVGSSV